MLYLVYIGAPETCLISIKMIFGCYKNKMIGKIELIVGPMFAGKSTELIRRIKRHQIAGYNSLVVKYANDTRYSNDSVSTHDK
jgi:thymidine kinase